MSKKLFFTYCLFLLITGFAKEGKELEVKVVKWEDGLIIPPGITKEVGDNVQGPSLIKVPDWLDNPLGNYYLYFADHKGDHIRLAYSDHLKGPWRIHTGGSLKLEQSKLLSRIPDEPENFDASKFTVSGYKPHPDQAHAIPTRIDDMTIPHIASPDVHVDEARQEIIMYYHGLEKFGLQQTRVATSTDGILFSSRDKIVGWPYFRAFSYKGKDYAMSMPGIFYERKGDIEEFEIIHRLFDDKMRHAALLVHFDTLLIFYSNVGDNPESILLSTINLKKNPDEWNATEPVEVLRPEKEWEGGNLPLQPSSRSAINIPVNQVRDPAVFEENGKFYLLYSVRGENGIAIADLLIN